MDILFFTVCVAWVLVPGLLLSAIVPNRFGNFIFIPVWSWVFLSAILLIARGMQLPVGNVPWLLYGSLVALAFLSGWRWQAGFASVPIRGKKSVAAGAVAIVGIYTAYFFWAGAYVEIPADIFSHLDKLQNAFSHIASERRLPWLDTLADVGELGDHWYVIFAYMTYHAGGRIETVYPLIAYVNTTLILLGVYHAALYLFRNTRLRRAEKVYIAAAATAFFTLHFGVNVFSYIRYYALAPTITAYLFYLASIIVAWEFFSNRCSVHVAVWFLGILILAALTVNEQEVIFIVITTWAMSIVRSMSGIAKLNERRDQNGIKGAWRAVESDFNRAAIVGLGGIVLGLMTVGITYAMLERGVPSRPWVAPVSEYLPFVNHLYILNPRFQLFHVFAVSGYVIYALFLVHIRDFRTNYFILAGMLIPFVTVLNPVFVDLYLRHQDAFTLYRMLYMVPFSFVGGYLLVKYLRFVIDKRSVVLKVGGGAGIVILLVSLLPFNVLYANNKYSRIYTILPTPEKNHPAVWGDLLGRLEITDRSKVVTDPVTGYVINGITKHEARTRKYLKVWIDLEDDEYEDDWDMFKEYDDYLLIINSRGGGKSRTGRISGHWSEDILRTSRFYSRGFVEFVRQNREMFVSLWRHDNISVYRIDYRENEAIATRRK